MKTFYVVDVPKGMALEPSARIDAFFDSIKELVVAVVLPDGGLQYQTRNQKVARSLQAWVDGVMDLYLDHIGFHDEMDAVGYLDLAERFRRSGLDFAAEDCAKRAGERL